MKKIIFLLSLFLATSAFSQNQQNNPCPCCTEQYRQFDFWVGNWEVTAANNIVGHNEIKIIQDSCIIRENWSATTSTFTGTSYNFYDRNTNNWNQLWVDNAGSVLKLSGGLKDGSMILVSDPVADKTGNINISRIIWTPKPNGNVRQHWEASSDGGQTWSTAFDGMYKRKKE